MSKEYNYPPHFRVKLQDGPMKEVGENGCHLQDVVALVQRMVVDCDNELPCFENKRAALLIEMAYDELCRRKARRIEEGTVGTGEEK